MDDALRKLLDAYHIRNIDLPVLKMHHLDKYFLINMLVKIFLQWKGFHITTYFYVRLVTDSGVSSNCKPFAKIQSST